MNVFRLELKKKKKKKKEKMCCDEYMKAPVP